MQPEQIENLRFDVINGKTHADNEYYLLANAIFKNLLVATPRCQELFNELMDRASLSVPAYRLRTAVYRRSQCRTLHAWQIALLETELHHAVDAFDTARKNMDTQPIIHAITHYTAVELKLPWKRMIYELIVAWHWWVTGLSHGQRIRIHPKYGGMVPGEIKTPFDEPMETYKAEIERTKKRLAWLKTMEKQNDLPKGKKKWNLALVERYTEWFFRRKVKGESINHLCFYNANGEKLLPHEVYGKTEVRKGIAIAEGWLSLGGYRLDLERGVELQEEDSLQLHPYVEQKNVIDSQKNGSLKMKGGNLNAQNSDLYDR